MVAWLISLFLGVKRVQVSWIQGIPNMCSLLVVIILCCGKLGLSYFIHIYSYPFTAFWLIPSPFGKLLITFAAQSSSPPMVGVVLSSVTQSFLLVFMSFCSSVRVSCLHCRLSVSLFCGILSRFLPFYCLLASSLWVL